jgi:hypothetical protein
MEVFWDRIHEVNVDSEADVELRVIEPLLEALGYDRNKDLSRGYTIRFGEGRKGRPHEADYVVFDGTVHDRNTSLIVVEAKAPH